MFGGSAVGCAAAADRQGTESVAAAAALIVCVFTASLFFTDSHFFNKAGAVLSMILTGTVAIDPGFSIGV
jgi:hypothetical protein